MALEPKNFDDLITFARASTASYYNQAGLLTQAIVDQPRFDHDPVTKVARGLLIEESRTNILSDSADFTVWHQFGDSMADMPITPAAEAGPRGQATMTKIERTEAGKHCIRKEIDTEVGARVTETIYAKAGSIGKFLAMSLEGDASNYANASFNLETGECFVDAAPAVTGAAVSMESLDGGVWRCCLTATGTSMWRSVAITPHIEQNYLEDECAGLADVFVDAAQVEVGAFHTSYIPTAGAQVTRAADSVGLSTLSSWYNVDAGTLVVEAQADWGGAARGLVALVGADPAMDASFSSIMGIDRIPDFTQGGVAIDPVFPPVDLGEIVKVGIAADLTGSTLSVNGTNVAAVEVASPLVDRMWIGATTAAGAKINGHVRAIRYYPVRLTDDELQVLTR